MIHGKKLSVDGGAAGEEARGAGAWESVPGSQGAARDAAGPVERKWQLGGGVTWRVALHPGVPGVLWGRGLRGPPWPGRTQCLLEQRGPRTDHWQENEGGTGKRKCLNQGLMRGLTFWLKQKHRVNIFLKKSGCGRLYRMQWFPELMFCIVVIN